MLFGKKKKPKPIPDHAGPVVRRDNIKYRLPLPEEGAPVYFGDQAYQKKYEKGFSGEELELARKQALQDFNPHSVGEGRVRDWRSGPPKENRQGIQGELDGLSISAPTSDRTLSDPQRKR